MVALKSRLRNGLEIALSAKFPVKFPVSRNSGRRRNRPDPILDENCDHSAGCLLGQRLSAVILVKVLVNKFAHDANVTVINFNMKDAAGTDAIRFAETNKIDLIFAMGSESTAWLFDNYRGGKIPVVSVCSKDPVQLGQIKDYERGGGSNFAFTSLNVPVEVQMAYVKELKPDLKNFGRSSTVRM